MLGNPLKWMIWGYPHSWKLSTRRIIESWKTVCQKLHRLRIVSMLSRRSTAEDQPRGRYGAGSWETCGIVGPLVSLISLLRSTSKHIEAPFVSPFASRSSSPPADLAGFGPPRAANCRDGPGQRHPWKQEACSEGGLVT